MATAEQYAEWIVANKDRRGTPEFETVAQAYKLAKGGGDGGSRIPGFTPAKPVESRDGTNLIGMAEAGATLASGAIGTLAGQAAGLYRGLTGGKFGTPEGVREGAERAREVASRFTYQPRTDEGRNALQSLSNFMDVTKLAGLGPTEAMTLSALAPAAAQQTGNALRQTGNVAANAAGRAKTAVMDRIAPEPQMAGVGSASVYPEAAARARAEGLPVPVRLTKGEATRNPEQVKFEAETAKQGGVGAPLRERKVETNDRILQNFEAFVDQTGSQAPGMAGEQLRAVGKVVDAALVKKANEAKAKINKAYEAARASGELEMPVDVSGLIDFLTARRAQSLNAGVIGATRKELEMLAGAAKKDAVGNPQPRTISINDLEEIRKTVVAAQGKDATNAHWAKEIKNRIDAITESAGGDAYKYARKLRTDYAREFENVGVVDKLMSTKPGSTDRRVAFEDVFKHSILDGSLDDVRAIRRTLQTAGAEGQQAWRELQGQTVRWIRDQTFGNAARNEARESIASFPKLKAAIDTLESDGKLDFVFGKHGAQKLRDLREVVADYATVPPSAAMNYSNTATTIMNTLNEIGLIPTAVKVGKQFITNRATRKRVAQSLDQPESLTLKDLGEMSRRGQ